MSSQLGEAFVPIRATLDKLDKDLAGARNKMESALGGLAKSAASFGVKIGKAVAIGTTAVAVGAVALTGTLLSAGSDVAEMQSKFDKVFGQEAQGARKELDEMASTLGRNKFALQGYAAGLQDTFVPLGFARDKAAEMSVQSVQLIEDLSSFDNLDSDEVFQDIQTALVGNTEVMRKYGVVINQAAIEQEAMNLGLAQGSVDAGKVTKAQNALENAQLRYNEAVSKYGKNSSQATKAGNALENAQINYNKALEGGKVELDAQAKAQAIYSLILKGTQDAQGDAERTAGGWANQMRRLWSIITQTRDEIGLKLLPVFEPLLQKFTDFAASAAPKVVAAFDSIVPQIQGFVEKITGIGQQIISSFQAGGIQQVLQDVLGISPDSPVFAFLGQLPTLAGAAFDQVIQFVQNAWATLQSWATWLITEGGPAFLDFVQPIIDKVQPIFLEIVDIIQGQILPTMIGFVGWLIAEGVPKLIAFVAPIVQQIIPGLIQLREWITKITAFVLPLLVQAVQFVIENMDVVGPVLAAVGAVILALNAPITFVVGALVALATAWANNWGGIREKTQAAIDFLRPILERLGEVLGGFIQELLPKLKEVWGSLVDAWQNQVGPALAELKEALGRLASELGLTGNDVSGFEIALGALKLVLWLVLAAVNVVIVIINAWAAVLTFIISMIIQTVDNVIRFKDKVVDMYRSVQDAIRFVKDLASTLIRAIPDAIRRAIRSIEDLIVSLARIVIPDWLIPGSPTPFELGLRGIGKAAQVAGRQMTSAFNRIPDFSSKFGGAGLMMERAGALAGGQGETSSSSQQISKSWSLTINSPVPPDVKQSYQMMQAMEI